MGQSWSGIKKRLEKDLLAQPLRGRVNYFMTRYRKHDNEERFAIIVDGKEVLKTNVSDFYELYSLLFSITKDKIDRELIEDEVLLNKEKIEIEECIENKLLNERIFSSYLFTNSITEYLNQSIDKSLYSKNYLTRILAILDRRVGKRSLKKISLILREQPEWVQVFYKLRLDAERILY